MVRILYIIIHKTHFFPGNCFGTANSSSSSNVTTLSCFIKRKEKKQRRERPEKNQGLFRLFRCSTARQGDTNQVVKFEHAGMCSKRYAFSSEHRYLCRLHRRWQHRSNLCSKIYVANIGIYVANIGINVGNVQMKRELVRTQVAHL